MDNVQYTDEVSSDVALPFLSSPGLAVILLPWLLLLHCHNLGTLPLTTSPSGALLCRRSRQRKHSRPLCLRRLFAVWDVHLTQVEASGIQVMVTTEASLRASVPANGS